MMREIIAEKICKAMQKTNYGCKTICQKRGLCAYCLVMAEELISNGVTVQENTGHIADVGDMVDVKHGYWIPHKPMIRDPYARNYDCSECGNSPIECGEYCNKCGARMDGEAKALNNTNHSVDINKMVQNQWISVNEQLPETYIEVLVCFKADGSKVIAFVNRFGKWKNASTDNLIESEITHWMPLPAPPEKGA